MSLDWQYQLIIEEIEETIGRDFDTLSFKEQDMILENGLEKWRNSKCKKK